MSTRSDIEKELLLDWEIDLEEVTRVLAKYGLHIVTSADKKVLEASRDWFDSWGPVYRLEAMEPVERELYESELARRESLKA